MDTVSLIGRLLVSLAAVLGVIWVLARRMKRTTGGTATQLIDVLGRQQLSRTASVAVVRVGEQALVLGVTDAQVSVLGETDLGTAQAMVAGPAEPRRASPRGAARRSAGTHAAVPAAAVATAAHARAAHSPAPHAPAPHSPAPAVPAPAPHAPVAAPAAHAAGPLGGSVLSPQTWRQTLDSLRDLTARQA